MQLRLVPSWLVALMLVSQAAALQAEEGSLRTEVGMLFGVVSRGADDTGGGTMIDLPGGEIPGPGRSLPRCMFPGLPVSDWLLVRSSLFGGLRRTLSM